VIRNHILQSLISHPTLRYHQAYVLIILFKLAGPTFEAYADPSVVDRCFEFLKNYRLYDPERGKSSSLLEELERSKQVCTPRVVKCGHRSKTSFQPTGAWVGGSPSPPMLSTGKPTPAGVNQNDPAATPVVISLGLPSRNLQPQIIQTPSLEPQTPQTPPLELATIPKTDIVHASPVIPITRSPSIGIATISDFTIADVSDGEPPVDPTASDTSDEELPIDPTATIPLGTFHVEDGNVEVLCGNTLPCHRQHSILLFPCSPPDVCSDKPGHGRIIQRSPPHSILRQRQGFCYTPQDSISPRVCCFTHVLLGRHTDHRSSVSTDSPNGIKYWTSLHSHPSFESRKSTRYPLPIPDTRGRP